MTDEQRKVLEYQASEAEVHAKRYPTNKHNPRFLAYAEAIRAALAEIASLKEKKVQSKKAYQA